MRSLRRLRENLKVLVLVRVLSRVFSPIYYRTNLDLGYRKLYIYIISMKLYEKVICWFDFGVGDF